MSMPLEAFFGWPGLVLVVWWIWSSAENARRWNNRRRYIEEERQRDRDWHAMRRRGELARQKISTNTPDQ